MCAVGVPKALIRNVGRIACGVAFVVSIGACGDDDSTVDTTVAPATAAPTTVPVTTPFTTEPAPVTTMMGADLESLSYLIQGLLTTEQIGGGWVDQGRQIVPPGSNQLSGFLCEEGEATVADLGDISLGMDPAPDLGTTSVSFHFGPATVPSGTPWLEQRVTSVLLSDPSQPVALVVTVGALVTHDSPTTEPTALEPAEYDRIVQAAVGRIMDGL
jgi:hypothetical protein